jgi:hypothetical protein
MTTFIDELPACSRYILLYIDMMNDEWPFLLIMMHLRYDLVEMENSGLPNMMKENQIDNLKGNLFLSFIPHILTMFSYL